LNLQSSDYKAGVLTSRPPSLDDACDAFLVYTLMIMCHIMIHNSGECCGNPLTVVYVLFFRSVLHSYGLAVDTGSIALFFVK